MENTDVLSIAAAVFVVGLGMGLVIMDNANRNYEHIKHFEDICAKFDSTPYLFDTDDELVCANGVRINYTTYGDKR